MAECSCEDYGKMIYRKKPVEVEATKFDPDIHPWPDGVKLDKFTNRFYIETLEGKMIVTPGDMVITGVAGEKYACKPDIFEKTYERA